ncbi:MAG TPA: leucine-rich repeat protein [Verrucomicrobiae bacterium]|jgi:hypothetical protein|nr:leucine-rich repeat protein [Verrucomicrobiae bacterium]
MKIRPLRFTFTASIVLALALAAFQSLRAQPTGYPLYPNQAFSWLAVGTGTETWTSQTQGSEQISAFSPISQSVPDEVSFGAPESGTATVSYTLSVGTYTTDGTISTVYGRAEILDSSKSIIKEATYNVNGPFNQSGSFTFGVTAAQTYYLQVSAASATASYPALVSVVNTAVRTASDNQPATVNASQGQVDLGGFYAEPQAADGGAISGVSYRLSDNNANVVVVFSDTGTTSTANPNAHVYASTIAPPSITTPPQSVSIMGGSSANFTVAASGAGTLNYQWYYGSLAIQGATSSSYTIPSASVSNNGAYSVVVSNAVGAVLSSAATLTVNVIPFAFTTNNGGIVITGYTGTNTLATIPSTINGLPVSSIESNAFVGGQFSQMLLPTSIVSIGEHAFQNCSYLTSIILPHDLTNLGSGTFQSCYMLTNVVLPNGLQTIADSAFSETGLASIILPDSITNIGMYAFFQTDLSSIQFGTNVTSIGIEAFYNCYFLTNIFISKSVMSIGQYALSCPTLLNITVDAANLSYSSLNGVLLDRSQSTLLQYPAGLSGSYTIPPTVVIIGPAAFLYCKNLTDVSLPYGVTNIGDQAFDGCSGLTNINIVNSVLQIGESAFYACSNLRQLTIADSVTSIGSEAFLGCSSLSYIHLGQELLDINSNAFESCPALTNVVIPRSVTNIGPFAFWEDSGLSNVTFGTTNCSIGASAFQGCNLNAINLQNGITSIGSLAFAGNDPFSGSSLSNVVIGSSVTNIGTSAFAYCYNLDAINVNVNNPIYISINGVLFARAPLSLTEYPPGNSANSYTIPYGCISIGPGAFEGCTNITTVNLPNTVRSIGISAFQDCTKITSITLPNSLNFINSSAFADCPALQSVYFGGNAPSIGTLIFGSGFSRDSATIYYLPGTAGWAPSFAGLSTSLWTLPYPIILSKSVSWNSQNKTIGFRISWATNLSVIVESSSNLNASTWQPINTNMLAGGFIDVSQPVNTDDGLLFFRARAE